MKGVNFLVLLFFVFNIVKGNSIDIKSNISIYDTKEFASIAFVKHLDFNFDNLNFTPFSANKIPSKNGVILLKFKVKTDSLTDKLYLNAAYFDSIAVYKREDTVWTRVNQRAGFLVPMDLKTIKNARTSLVPIPTNYNDDNEYIVALFNVTKAGTFAANVSSKIGLHLYTLQGLSIFNTHKNLAFLVSGVLLLMIIINCGIYILGRRKSYLYLVIYNILFLLAIVSTNGLLHDLGLLNNTENSRIFRLLMWSVAPIFYLVFGSQYLHLKKYLPRAYLLVRIAIVLNILCLIPFLFSNISLIFAILPYIAPINAFLLLIIALVLSKRGFVPAKFMVFASLLLFFGYTFVIVGAKSSLIPFVYTEIVMILFFLLELAVFSIAIFSELRYIEKKSFLETQKRLEIEKDLNKKNRELVYTNLKLLNNENHINQIIVDEKGGFNEIKQQLKKLKSSSNNWDNIFKHFLDVEPLFFNKLAKAYPKLTSNDLKLCAFLKMKLTTKEIATINGVSEIAVSKSRNRLRKKLDMQPGEDIISFITNEISEITIE